jgi:hypothetical protein
MMLPAQKLGRVLAGRSPETRTRPSYRPPPNLLPIITITKGRSAALRRFSILKKAEEVSAMTTGK